MSFSKHNLGVEVEDVPEFPDDSLPPGTRVNVPFPVNNHPTWTTYPYNGVDIPDTFDNLITLPDARHEPVLYAAAVDTIRMTNRYFELVGQYSKKWPLTEKLVRQKEREWRSMLVREDGELVKHFPSDKFPRPPDLRTLFVKEAMGDPTDDNLNALWIRACSDLHRMSKATKERYLSYTREQLVEKAKFRPGNDDSWLILEAFKRYLVWREFCMEKPEDEGPEDEEPEDEQPTRAEMEAFFNDDDVKENGATLVEICHAFPHARNTQMLVYRIERFATLIPQPSVKTKAGADDPVESRYMRNKVPTEKDIKAVVSYHLGKEGVSASYPELVERFWPDTGNQQFIADVLVTIARPDVTTGRFILMTYEGPDANDIYNTMKDKDWLDGFTLVDIAQRFRNRVWSLEELRHNMSEFAYFDEDEQRYFPLYESEEDKKSEDDWPLLSREESMAHRNRFRTLVTWNPETIHQDYTWDRSAQRYVRRPERLQLSEITDVETQPVEPYSPTELVSNIAGSPPPEAQNTLQIGVVAAVETTPIDPPSALSIEGATGPSGTQTPAGSPPAPAEPEKGGRGRPPKRAATEPPESSRDTKKARKTLAASKIQCSQHTQKGTRCKKKKERAEGEEDWDCGVHNRS